jgi:hypothetical protein
MSTAIAPTPFAIDDDDDDVVACASTAAVAVVVAASKLARSPPRASPSHSRGRARMAL